MCSTWAATVLGDRNRAAAISRLVRPTATSRATSNSRAVSGAHGSAGRWPAAAASSRSASATMVPVEQGPGPLPEAAARPPAGRGPLQGRPGGGQVPLGQGDQAPAVVDGDQGPGPGRGRGQPGPHPGDQVREQVGGVADPGRGGMPAVAQLHRRRLVAAEQGRLGQAPQGRRQALELGHGLALAEGVAEQLAGPGPVGPAHGQVAEDVLGGDPGGDAAAPVGQGVLGRPVGQLPAADRPLHVGQVGGHVVAVVPELDPLGVVDAGGQPPLGPVVLDQHRGTRTEHPVAAGRLRLQAPLSALAAASSIAQPSSIRPAKTSTEPRVAAVFSEAVSSPAAARLRSP